MEPRESHGLSRALGVIPFVFAHLAVFGAIFSGVSWESVVCGIVLLVVRQWAVTAGYHRYFSHRAFKTSRAFQFVLAFLAQTSSQKGVLWWASHHRVHHKESDKPGDPHSPLQRGYWYAHVGWFFDGTEDTRFEKIPDLARYPELRWLNRYWIVPPLLLGLAVFLLLGWSGLFIGFFASTVLLWHNTFLVNSLTHVWGRKRFPSGDESRNSLIIAITTLGEGWHNNHHYYQSSARNGFYWWEIDPTYYALVLLSRLGIVWDLRPVPERVLAEGRRLDRARAQLVGSPVSPSR